MQTYITLMRRELSAYFVSITGYVIISSVAFLLGWSFVNLIWLLITEPSPMPLTEVFYLTPYFWLILLPLPAVITMRVFAQEKFSGTFETLMTAPVSDMQVVLAKFTAALIFFMICWLPLLVCIVTLLHFNNQSDGWDAGTLGSTFFGIFLLGCMLISLGCFASAVTRSQVVAVIMSLAGTISLFLLSFAPHLISAKTGSAWAQILETFGVFYQMHDFSRGVVDTRPVVLYVSLTLFFLYLTLRAVESRRWK